MRFNAYLILFFLPFLSYSQVKENKLDIQPTVHWRTYWMSTSYSSEFKDDYALGSSLSLGIKGTFSDRWKIQAAYRGFANIWSSDIWEVDPISGQSNRYETGLFNYLEPGQDVFGTLELFSLSYQTERWHLAIGRMGINTAWINPADGRLAPTLMEGASASFTPNSKWKLSGWYINRFLVRGTNRYLPIGESTGIYGSGRGLNGSPSQYVGNTHSDFVSVLQVDFHTEGHKFSLSQTLTQNISSTFWAEWNYNLTNSSKELNWIMGAQAGFQHGIGEGGNPDPILRYKDPTDQNWVFSAQGGLKIKKWKLISAFTKTGGNGRWLSPREWGKDAWFTFIPRERNEGFESLTATTFLAEFYPSANWSIYGHLGFHWLPEVQNAAANKYALPSYRQVNLGVKYRPSSRPKMDFHLLMMNKEALNADGLTAGQRYNKVGLLHVNLIANFRID
jgi:hypothetical protein